MKNKATLLVTTDFSTNSKSAIRFALQLATQMDCKLVFYHVLEFMPPLAWHESKALAFTERQIMKSKNEFKSFLKHIYKQAGIPTKDYDYTVEVGMDVDNMIVKYAQKIKADFICMSTRGITHIFFRCKSAHSRREYMFIASISKEMSKIPKGLYVIDVLFYI